MRPTNRETSLFFALVIVALSGLAEYSRSQMPEPTTVIQRPWAATADVQRGIWLRPPFPESPYPTEPDKTIWTKWQMDSEHYGWKPVQTVTRSGTLIIDGWRYTAKQLADEGWKYTRDPFVTNPVEYDCRMFVEKGDGL